MTRSDLTDRIMAICAIIVAAASLTVAVYEARTNREYQKLSVWPYLRQSNAMVPGESYMRNISNLGVGPALIKSVRVSVDGRPQRDWAEVSRALTGRAIPELVYSSFHSGSVLLPDKTSTVLTIPPGDTALKFWEQAQTERLSIRVCYCSLYDDCWLSDSGAEQPAPVPTCRLEEGQEFMQ
jgi:hypothetical protein